MFKNLKQSTMLCIMKQNRQKNTIFITITNQKPLYNAHQSYPLRVKGSKIEYQKIFFKHFKGI